MAVQAQYRSNAFSQDFRDSGRNNALEELQKLQERNLLGPYAQFANINAGGTVFSGPQSELTCIASSSRKRRADEQQPAVVAMDLPPLPNQTITGGVPFQYIHAANEALAPGNGQMRLMESRGTSTSGRPFATSAPLPVSNVSNDLISHLYRYSVEVDALVRLQNEKLRIGIEEARKRHCRAVLSAVEQQAIRRLSEKESELEKARLRNAELEEKLRQMSAESQVWFDAARNNEAMAAALRSSLEQALLAATAAGDGSGDCSGPAEDVGSCCFEGDGDETPAAAEEEICRRTVCKVCGERDVCVLLLPCRHLCLCKECQPKAATCPVCCSSKNAALEIFLC